MTKDNAWLLALLILTMMCLVTKDEMLSISEAELSKERRRGASINAELGKLYNANKALNIIIGDMIEHREMLTRKLKHQEFNSPLGEVEK